LTPLVVSDVGAALKYDSGGLKLALNAIGDGWAGPGLQLVDEATAFEDIHFVERTGQQGGFQPGGRRNDT
jgi:hypothetical protein